jgi:hypothetical protein
MTFEGEIDAVRAVVNADVGRQTRSNELTAAMASVVPEPDLARVNAGTGPQLQLDSVWSVPSPVLLCCCAVCAACCVAGANRLYRR